jgi:hypothetical protein
VTDPAGGEANWVFTMTRPDNSTLTGTTDASGNIVWAGGGALADLPLEGQYTITETAKPGFTQVSATGCTFTVNYPADAGQTFSCTITNRQDATLKIVKVTNPADSGTDSFPFTSSSTGVDASFSLDTHTAGHDSKTFTFSGALSNYGVKTVVEGATQGWFLHDVSCTKTNSGSGATATVTVNPGDTVVCTFTNWQNATLKIVKVTQPVNSGADAFNFSATGTGVTTPFTLDTNGADLTNPSNITMTFDSAAKMGEKTVTEGAQPAGWTFVSKACVGANDLNSPTNPTADVVIVPGATVVCTYTDVKGASLTIVKDTNPVDSGTDTFPYTGSGTNVAASFSLDTHTPGHEMRTFTFSPTQFGTKTVTEGLTQGWTFTNVTCVGDDTNSTPGGSTVTLDVQAGDNTTCTYHNVKDAKLTIVKATAPVNSGGDSFSYATSFGAPAFNLDTNTGDATYPISKSFTFHAGDFGAKSVTEGTTVGWNLTNITCDKTNTGSGSTATVTLVAGDDVTCTFTNKKQATFTLVKVTNPADSGTDTFPFVVSGDGTTTPVVLDTHTAGHDTKVFTFTGLPGADYGVKTAAENPTPGWALMTATCTGGTDTDASLAGVAVNVQPGDNVVCTYTNDKDASLTVIKVTQPGNSGSDSFGFTHSGTGVTDFTLDTNPVDLTNSDRASFTFSGQPTNTFGVKSVTESTVPNGWQLVSKTCDGANDTQPPTSATATVNIVPGAVVTCTYTNVKAASLTIIKDTNPVDSGTDTFPFTGTGDGVTSSFSLDTHTPGHETTTFTFQNGQFGTKTVSEGTTPGWTFTGVDCVGDEPNTGTGATVNVNIQAGENVTCTYHNVKDAKLTINKVTAPADSGAATFPFTTSFGAPAFSLDTHTAGHQTTSFTFHAGSFGSKSVTEGTTVGWNLTDVTCDKTNTGTGSTATVNLVAGDNVTCTFTNKKAATFTLVKVTQPADSGSDTFSYAVSGDGTTTPVVLDTHTAGNNTQQFTFTGLPGHDYGVKSAIESVTAGWVLTTATCSGGTDTDATLAGVSVNVQPGDNVTCTYTNVKDATLTIVKVTDPADSGTATFPFTTSFGAPAFSLDTHTAGHNSKSFTFHAGDFGSKSVTEGSTTGWAFISKDCSGATDTGTGKTATVNIVAGASVTCTFHNQITYKVGVHKTVNGLPVPAGTTFTFQLRTGATLNAAGTVLDTQTTDANGNLTFAPSLTPGVTYQLCEQLVAGFGPNFVGGFTPFPPDGDVSYTCINFTLSTADVVALGGATKVFAVDNSHAFTKSLTIGYWKNHSPANCKASNGNQQDFVTPNLPVQAGPLSISVACQAVNLLQKQNINGVKEPGDPIYNMVAQLIGAELNVNDGNGTCSTANDVIKQANDLLNSISFDGVKSYTKILNAAQTALANDLGNKLDLFNNNHLC